MRHFTFACLTLAMVFSAVYVLTPANPSRADDLRIGHPVASIGEIFRHY